MQGRWNRQEGARVEMIEAGEPRPLAGDEVLLEVRVAGVATGMRSSAPAAGTWAPSRRWRWAWRQPATGCPFRKSYPDVLVVQSSQDRNGDDSARSLDGWMQGRIFL